MNHPLKSKLILLSCTAISVNAVAQGIERPNIVLIVADDIGYGDLGCYGATKIKTPNIDNLAANGVRFTNAYSEASTSSPTRYSLLTGEYAWRKGVGILAGDAPLSIDVERNTLPKQLKSVGYKSAIVGKWHLGLGSEDEPVDFNKKIKNGMKAVGFDYSYIFPATNDRVPTIYIENDKVVGLDKNDPIKVSYNKKIGNEPTGKENPNLLRLKHFQNHDGTIINGVGRIGWMTGGNEARWVDEEMTEVFLNKAVDFIDESYKKPFFLYYATHTAHEPRIASAKFRGHSEIGVYGDVIEEFDYCVGEIVATLKEKGILDNTIIIVTSDNGPMVKEGYLDGAAERIENHDPFNGLRGTKYSLHEGGSRVPFVLAWGDKIDKSFLQEQRFCYMDLLATFADITNSDALLGSFHDSCSAAELFVNKEASTYRPYIVTQDNPGNITIRKGDWKLIPLCRGYKEQLYNLKDDPQETNNLIENSQYSDIANELRAEVKRLKNSIVQ
ncbi:MAG: arylsulfatase [Rikenellaceae bacterium]